MLTGKYTETPPDRGQSPRSGCDYFLDGTGIKLTHTEATVIFNQTALNGHLCIGLVPCLSFRLFGGLDWWFRGQGATFSIELEQQKVQIPKPPIQIKPRNKGCKLLVLHLCGNVGISFLICSLAILLPHKLVYSSQLPPVKVLKPSQLPIDHLSKKTWTALTTLTGNTGASELGDLA